MEADPAPGHLPTCPARRKVFRAVLEIGLCVEDLKDPAGTRAGARDQPPALGELVYRSVKLSEVRDEYDQLADRQHLGYHCPRPGKDDQRSTAADYEIDRPGVKRLPAVRPQCRPQTFPARPHETSMFFLLFRECLHELDGRHRRLDERIDAALDGTNLGGDID